MKGEYRTTPLGGGLMMRFVAALVLFVGPRGVQAASFVVIALVVCVGAMWLLSRPGGNFTALSRAQVRQFVHAGRRAGRTARPPVRSGAARRERGAS